MLKTTSGIDIEYVPSVRGGYEEYFPHYYDGGETIKTYNDHMIGRFSAIKPTLIGELALACAPLTSRLTSCVLETDKGLYGGHVMEQADGEIVPASIMALSRTPSNEVVTGVWLTGKDVERPKYIMPPVHSYDELASRLDPYAPMVVVEPNTYDSLKIISPDRYREAYEPQLPYLEIKDSYWEIHRVLEEETSLELEDREFLIRLRDLGIQHGIAFYLTGSSSRNGGPSGIFTRNWTYGDIDLIAISDINEEEVRKVFEELATLTYGEMESLEGNVNVWPSGETRNGLRYVAKAPRYWSSIHLFISDSLANVVIRPEYFERNFFLKVS